MRTGIAVLLGDAMPLALQTPYADEVRPVVCALRDWQHDEAPLQLHPGDVGWYWRFGAATTAAALRTWTRDGALLAVGLLDEPNVIRLALAPTAHADDELARRLTGDLEDPARGVLPAGKASVEAPAGSLVRQLLGQAGWTDDEPWTPLRLDLSKPVTGPAMRVDIVRAEQAAERVAVQRAAFTSSTFTVERWHEMAAGLPYANARCLVAYDDDDFAVAAATVWSAGGGRPGLLEPLGVHRDHRGHGYGRAITRAAAATLQDLGSSSAVVCTPSSNVGAVATYLSAGFEQRPDVRDKARDA